MKRTQEVSESAGDTTQPPSKRRKMSSLQDIVLASIKLNQKMCNHYKTRTSEMEQDFGQKLGQITETINELKQALDQKQNTKVSQLTEQKSGNTKMKNYSQCNSWHGLVYLQTILHISNSLVGHELSEDIFCRLEDTQKLIKTLKNGRKSFRIQMNNGQKYTKSGFANIVNDLKDMCGDKTVNREWKLVAEYKQLNDNIIQFEIPNNLAYACVVLPGQKSTKMDRQLFKDTFWSELKELRQNGKSVYFLAYNNDIGKKSMHLITTLKGNCVKFGLKETEKSKIRFAGFIIGQKFEQK